jgi:LacI family transcriptional regulator
MAKIPKVILLIESSRASGRSLLRGIADYARHHGPWAFYWEPGGLEKAWPRLKSLEADGIILRDVEKVEEVLALGIPAVVFGHSQREIPGLVNILTDGLAIGRLAAEHLVSCGFKHLAYCGFEDKPWSEERWESFRERGQLSGCQTGLYHSPSVAVERSWKQEQQALARWLKSLPKPVGLMACNDDRGQHVIETCKVAGLHVPDEVAVIGADNDELVCELSDPPLSSVVLNFERAGYEGAEQLARLMRGKAATQSRIMCTAGAVVARQSTDISATLDARVAKSLRFIRDHARQAIHVDDVVQASGLSRRVLEKSFRKILGRSILHEIRRVRVGQICRMLVETNQPISAIALALGYAGVEHVARYFRMEKRMTPLGYRKRYGRP